MAEGVFPPIVADVLILLSVALGVIALIMAAGVASLQKQMRDDVKKIVGLEHDVAKLKRQVAGLQAAQGEAGSAKEPHHADHGTPPQGEPHGASQALGGAQAAAPLTPAERQARAAQQPARPQNVWTPMLMDYNSLAASMQVPRADEACQAFIDIHHIQMLPTRAPSSCPIPISAARPTSTRRKAIKRPSPPTTRVATTNRLRSNSPRCSASRAIAGLLTNRGLSK